MSAAQYVVVWLDDFTLNVTAVGPYRSRARALEAHQKIEDALLSVALDDSSPASVVRMDTLATTLQRLKPTEQALGHDFLPVNGHPDDDECTHRADGTDATYCGEPKAAHQPTEPEPASCRLCAANEVHWANRENPDPTCGEPFATNRFQPTEEGL